MKLSTFLLSFVTLGLALTQTSATPLRVEYIPLSKEASNGQIGHAATPANPNVAQIVRISIPPTSEISPFFVDAIDPQQAHKATVKKHGCTGMRGMRGKAIRVSNWIRVKLGMPRIEGHGSLHGGAAVMPANGTSSNHPDIQHYKLVSPHQMHRMHHTHRRPTSFIGRIHRALMALGPWEGRAVAFVLGCGIGSLLRMFWILFILTFRSIKSERTRENECPLLAEEAVGVTVSMPKYTDDKVEVIGTEVSA